MLEYKLQYSSWVAPREFFVDPINDHWREQMLRYCTYVASNSIQAKLGLIDQDLIVCSLVIRKDAPKKSLRSDPA